MALNHGLLLLAVVVVVVVAGTQMEEGCISMKTLQTSTFHDEMNVSFCRHERDVILKVTHSKGECKHSFRDQDIYDNKWTSVKLNLNNITMSGNGKENISLKGNCAASPNTVKKVSIEGAAHILSRCSQGPAIYQISSEEDLLIPWYEDQVRLVLKALVDTQIKIKAGDQDFMICFNGTHTAAQKNSSTCSGGVNKTSNIYVTIPKSKDIIKVKTMDEETDTPMETILGDKPLQIYRVSTGPVIVRQCIPECWTSPDFPEDSSCSCVVCVVFLVIFLLLFLVSVAFIVYRYCKDCDPKWTFKPNNEVQ